MAAVSKQDLLDALEKEGITDLDSLAEKAAPHTGKTTEELRSESPGLGLMFFRCLFTPDDDVN